MEAVVVVNADLRMEAIKDIKNRLRHLLRDDFDIGHAVFETEAPGANTDSGLIVCR